MGIFGKLLVAVLADKHRQHVKWLAVCLLAIQVVGFILLLAASDFYLVLFSTSLIGFSGGALIPIHPFLNSAYFHESLIGRVSGAQMPLFLPFGLIGPPLTGLVFDQTGSYLPAFGAVMVAYILSIVLLMQLPAVKN